MLTLNNQIPQLTIYQTSILLATITIGWTAIFFGLDHNKFKLKKKHSQRLFRFSALGGILLALLSALIINSGWGWEYFNIGYGWPRPFIVYSEIFYNLEFRPEFIPLYFLNLYFYTLIIYFISLLIFALKNKDKKLASITIATLIVTILVGSIMTLKNKV